MELKGKTAIVTGAGRGIGEGIALVLAREGASVVLTARKMHEISAVAGRIESQGGKALPLVSAPAHFEAICRMLIRGN